MEDYKNIVLPPGHVVEIVYGKTRMKFYDPKSVLLSVSVRKANKEDKK